MPDLISIGECLVEFSSDRPLEKAESFRRSLGGDTLNILIAAGRLGTTTGYVTRLAGDPFARYMLRTWREEGIDVTHAKEVDGFNAVSFVSILPGGDRDFIYYRKGSAASTLEPSDLDLDYIASCRVLHLSGTIQAISPTARATVRRAAEIARERDVDVSYDPNYRRQLWTPTEARAGMEEVLPFVKYFLPSSPADTDVLFSTSDPYKVIKDLRARDVPVVAVKCGSRGAVLGTGEEIFEIPPYTAGPVVDTTGAGDAFNGGLLHGLLKGMKPKDAALIGSITAGINVRGYGAIAALPSISEVDAVLQGMTG